jgi:transcription initiation factor TFIIIB Brf1 subunit/transcription initiation factor TFIIB
MGRLPNNKALNVAGIKTKNVYDKKQILDKIYDTSPGNEVSKQISSIGRTLEVPEPIVTKAIDDYEKMSPTNKEPKIQVLAAAWLYLHCKKSKWTLTKQKINESIPGVSRNALNQAIESYRVFMRNLNGLLKESTNEES